MSNFCNALLAEKFRQTPQTHLISASLAVFGFILGCGVLLLKTSVVSGLIVILLGLLLLAGLILKGYYHLKRVREKRCEQEGEGK